MTAPRPWNLIAELTYRCPLRCGYCSNPVDWKSLRDGLDARAWSEAFAQAAALGVVHVGLTGGEPSVRPDLESIVAGAAEAGLFAHLVTAGTPIDGDGLATLRAAGLRSVQLSVQDDRPEASDRVAGTAAFERKRGFAAAVRALGLPLTLNVVLHRANVGRIPELVELASAWGARRVELAHAQYHGAAYANRAALLPDASQLREAAQAVETARRRHPRLEILSVLPDWYAGRPKPCMDGWGRRHLVVAPDGLVLPCHGARGLPGLEFWSVPARPLADCWREAPGMNAYRGEDWMPHPCRTCPERGRDFGGCRCQAWRLTGDAARTDPACVLAPDHARVREARAARSDAPPAYRDAVV